MVYDRAGFVETPFRSFRQRPCPPISPPPGAQPIVFSRHPRCQTLPLPSNQVAFGMDGEERLRWSASADAPRPFLFPLVGPSGLSLTRMGHPGAPNHDHHRSIWFAHQQLLGIDFWSDQGDGSIRQRQWLAYRDGDDWAGLAVELGWYDGHDPGPLMIQQVVIAVTPGADRELSVELQTTLTPQSESLELGQTNFGLLAVRVAKSISAVFGDGVLGGPGGVRGEDALFGKAWPWVDYSGSIAPGVTEGITYFDHPSNPGFPNKWHVRDDGWMGVSISRDGPFLLTRAAPLTLRYRLHAHRGGLQERRAATSAADFEDSLPFILDEQPHPHVAYAIRRASA